MTERDNELITIDDDGKRAFAVCTMPNGYEIRERIPRHVLKRSPSMSAGDETKTLDTSCSPTETSTDGAESQPDPSPSRCEQWPDHQPSDSSEETTSAC